ncbi:MAG: HAD hydrolase family protein [Syntrophomonadaceae bacterium]|nr:HAD hydrolase family protein [Syntrophomonadaceae bacterium]
MIRLVAFDIDGVLTDGCIYVDEGGNERKRINLKDIDAVFELKRKGYLLAAITAEDTPMTDYFERRLPWNYFVCQKNKRKALDEILSPLKIFPEEVCYVGDSEYDLEPIKYVGLGVCPADAINRVKRAADVVLEHAGGCGCVWDIVELLEAEEDK